MPKNRRSINFKSSQSIWAAVFLVSLLLGPMKMAHADPIAESQARLGRVTGVVEVLPQGAIDWLQAQTDLPIETGDQIRIEEEGQVELSIAENALWIVQGPALLVIGHTTQSESRLSMREGTIYGKVDPRQGRMGSWIFETPVSVCAVRGTEFVLTHSEDAGTELGVLKGTVEISPAESATETFKPVMIGPKESGQIQKRMALRKFNQWTPGLQKHTPRLAVLQQRFSEVGQVWSPFTTTYRTELRQKVVPAAKLKRPTPRRPTPSRRRKTRQEH
jgi:hypothetical protein